MGGYIFKQHCWVALIILVFGLVGLIPGIVRAEDGEDKFGNWMGANSNGV